MQPLNESMLQRPWFELTFRLLIMALMESHKSGVENNENVNESLRIYHDSLTASGHIDDSISIPPSTESMDDGYCGQPLNQQKLWIWFNGTVWLLISIISFPLLIEKEKNIMDFYNKEQCCFCLYAAKINPARIEWSTCYAKQQENLDPNDYDSVCSFNGDGYCSDGNDKKLSQAIGTLSMVTMKVLPKYYIYYGLLSIGFVILYLILIFLTTHKYKLLLPNKWFIGSIIVSIICYYPYIKLYQFRKQRFDLCYNPPPFKNGQNGYCYANSISDIGNTFLNLLAYYLEVYMIYLFYAVYPCICVLFVKCCKRSKFCERIGHFLETAFFYIVRLFYLL